MDTRQIGNDFEIRWRVFANGCPYNLVAEDLELELSLGRKMTKRIPFRVEGNEVVTMFYGKDQHLTGVYSLTLYDKRGRLGMHTSRVAEAFELTNDGDENVCHPSALSLCTNIRHLPVEVVTFSYGRNGKDGKDGIGIPSDGSVGQVLTKSGEGAYDVEWKSIDLAIAKVVQSLPNVGEEGKLYLVPSGEQTDANLYDEYLFVNGLWEKVGQCAINADLTKYLTKDDASATYAPKDKDAKSGNVAVFDSEGNPIDSGKGIGEVGGKVTVDSQMSDTSENPVQNKAIKAYADTKMSKATDAIAGNVAVFDANGNAVDSGKSQADFKGMDGEDGNDGEDGKSAFQYAQQGGYAGTEAEFAAELADIATQTYVSEQIASAITTTINEPV